ncbi:hypothetical protein B0J18DRAFT_433643 [Chaetomium sp. MPI-SDFR-AT-0129]|nr:hypothetical protein B0J18DRAFT_433643 [Chaetomium sp. MPI-SDFR-AT-0129]
MPPLKPLICLIIVSDRSLSGEGCHHAMAIIIPTVGEGFTCRNVGKTKPLESSCLPSSSHMESLGWGTVSKRYDFIAEK